MSNNEILFTVLRRSLWDETASSFIIPDDIRKELRDQTVESLTFVAYPQDSHQKYSQAAQFMRMAKEQGEALQVLQDHGIRVVVIKGTAVGIYYPKPYLRTYGDIDLLVTSCQYRQAIDLLRDNGWMLNGVIKRSHTALNKNSLYIELHQSPPGIDMVPEGKFILDYLYNGFDDIQVGLIDQPRCTFPMLPWKQNGLELIWHFREHLYNGIGLRHVIDWMMFAYNCLNDQAFKQFSSVLEQAGLLTLAQTVTRMCQLYLGLPEDDITWCAGVETSLCSELMEFILEQGNFGQKRFDDKTIKVMTRYKNLLAFLEGMQRKGLREWNAAQKHPALRPFAWVYSGFEGIKMILTHSGRESLRQARVESSQRNELFEKLYGKKS